MLFAVEFVLEPVVVLVVLLEVVFAVVVVFVVLFVVDEEFVFVVLVVELDVVLPVAFVYSDLPLRKEESPTSTNTWSESCPTATEDDLVVLDWRPETGAQYSSTSSNKIETMR